MAKNATRMGQERQFSNQAPAIASGGNIPSIQFSTGNAAALAQFSRTLFGLSSQFEDQLDETARAEASKEGAIAGLAGNTEEQTYETIRGRAYNQAMLETFVTGIDTKAMVGAARISQQYYNDPVGQERALNDFFGGMADEVDKVAPGAGASFRARQAGRALQSVEQARDTKFKLTRDEADAAMITYEASLMGAVKKNAAGLFSKNPAVSSAASASVTQTLGEYMRTYDAVDPVTGKPLYTPSEKAKAQVYMRDKVMSEATLSWFDQQEDKAAAYLQMQGDDFKFNINVPAEKAANVVYENQGSTRSQKVQPQVMSWLGTAAGAMGPGIEVHITSGGQPTAEEQRLARLRGQKIGGRTGSIRHDHGGSADVVLSVNGKKVTPAENPALYHQFVENAAAAGATGIGHYSWGVHIGGGSVAAWGPDTSGDTLDPIFGAAITRGRAKKGSLKLGEAQNLSVPIKTALSDAAYQRLDTEMRTRMNFENTLAERDRVASERKLKAEQDAAELEVNTRIFADGQIDPATGEPVKPITSMEVADFARSGLISSDQARAFQKAIATEKPERSDPAAYGELQRRMYEGEDVQKDILSMSDRLSKSDASALLSKNREMNVSSEGRFSPEEQFHFNQLDKLLTPDTMMASLDTNRQIRKYEALDEFRRRVKAAPETGESLSDIARDIKGRAVVDMETLSNTQLDGLVLPRFSVASDGKAGRWIDIEKSKANLRNALQTKKISLEAAQEQALLLQRWDDAQKQVTIDNGNAAKNKGK